MSAVVCLWLCGFCLERFLLPLGAWDGLRCFIVALPEPSYNYFLVICSGCAARFLSNLAGNPKDRFSHDAAKLCPVATAEETFCEYMGERHPYGSVFLTPDCRNCTCEAYHYVNIPICFIPQVSPFYIVEKVKRRVLKMKVYFLVLTRMQKEEVITQ